MSAHTPITPKRARRGASASHASALGAHPQGQAPLALLWPLWPLCALICALFTALGGAGCLEVGLLSDSSPALLTTPAGGGPVVRYDLLARPLPELPLPNDDATRYDPTSATGRRLNVSLLAPTLVERRAREGFDELDGFGTYAPITVSFDAPIDVLDLHARHNAHDPGAGLFRDDFRDDAVYLLNVDPSCARFGEEVALDVGRGRFPATLYKHLRATPDALAPEGRRVDFDDLFHLSRFDPHATANNILFEEWSEDLNGDGRLSPEEDRDGDGRLDRANLLREEACAGLAEGTVERSRCVADELMTFYDRSSNTLVLRPVWPLEQRCTYAAVLTNRLKGLGGEPARSPFAGRAAKSHEARLAPLGGLLARYGLTLEDVAFAWVFTTGTATRDLEALRAGLYGVGPFAALADQHPVTSLHIWTRGELDVDNELPASVKEDRLLPGPCVGLGVNKYWLVRGEWSANLCAIEADMAGLSGVFGGTFSAPDLLVDRVRSPSSAPLSSSVSEPHPADSADERWEVEAHSGRLVSGAAEVTFLCALPEERAEGCAPGNP